MSVGDRLNPRHKRFCEEYLLDLNGSAAYKRAGYRATDEAARRNASRLLTNADVQEYISELKAQQSSRTSITADRVLQEYARIAFSNLTDVVTFNQQGLDLKDSQQLPDDVKAAIASVTVVVTENEGGTTRKHSVRMHDKLKALDYIGNYLGLNKDLDQAIAAFRKYGFKPVQTDRGYEMVDEFKEGTTEGTEAE